MLKTYSQSVRANTKDLPCVNCQLMYEVLEENLREGREGQGDGRGKGMGGAETRNVNQEFIYCDNTHTHSAEVRRQI